MFQHPGANDRLKRLEYLYSINGQIGKSVSFTIFNDNKSFKYEERGILESINLFYETCVIRLSKSRKITVCVDDIVF